MATIKIKNPDYIEGSGVDKWISVPTLNVSEADKIITTKGDGTKYLSDDGSYKEVVTGNKWSILEAMTWDSLPNGVYAIGADGLPKSYNEADQTCTGIALVVNDAPTPQRFSIEHIYYGKYIRWDYSAIDMVGGEVESTSGCVDDTITEDYTQWNQGALGRFDGQYLFDNLRITNYEKGPGNGCYLASPGQLGLIFLYKQQINDMYRKIKNDDTLTYVGNYYYGTALFKYVGSWGSDCSRWIIDLEFGKFETKNADGGGSDGSSGEIYIKNI